MKKTITPQRIWATLTLCLALICSLALAGVFATSQTANAEEHTHAWAETWSSDGTNHWHECTAEGCTVTENSQKDGYGTHTGGTATCGHKATCTVCNKSYGDYGHVWSETWERNYSHHWRKCTVSSGCTANTFYSQLNSTYEKHIYTDAADADCNVCGYVRQVLKVTLTETNGTKTDIILDKEAPDGKWSWDSVSRTLTLKGWTGQSIIATGSFNIHLIGDNYINMPSNATSTTYGINAGNGTAPITADEGGTLTVTAENVTGNAKYYALYSTTLYSGTLNIIMNAAQTFTGTLNAFNRGWFFIGDSVTNINLNANGSTCNINAVEGNGFCVAENATVNVNIKGLPTKAYNGIGFYTNKPNGPFKGKIKVDIQGGSDSIAIKSLHNLTLGEGGSLEFSGGYARLNSGSNTFNRGANTQTTLPADDEFKTVYDETKKELWMCDMEGNKLTAGKFEYVVEKPPFETVGEEKDGELHVYTLPDMRVKDETINGENNWFKFYPLLSGYEQTGQINFEIVEGTLPKGLSISNNYSSVGTEIGIGGIPQEETPAGYVIIKATERVGEMRSVQFKVKWNEIKAAHVHNWSTSWTANETHHWHECNTTDCSTTENNKKDSYGLHTYNQQIATEDYKATNATHTAKATCYYSCICGKKGTTTFAYGETIPHEYDQQVTTDAYKATDATCTAKATYYFSCSCGEKGTTTFEYGDLLPHTYGDWQKDATNHWKACECGEKAEEAAHVYTDDNDTTCNVCGYERTITPVDPIEPIKKNGLSGGAVAGIVVGSVVLAGVGGFAIFWFVIKKKSFAELIALFKGVFKK